MSADIELLLPVYGRFRVLLEIAFATLIVIIVFGAIVAARSMADRRRNNDRRLVSPPDSGVGLISFVSNAQPAKRERFDSWFELAVRRSGLEASPIGVVAVMLLLATVLGAGLFIWKGQLGLAGLGIILGIGIPFAVVTIASRRYRKQLQMQLPDAYRMLAGSVRAGQTLEDAIEFYAEQGVKPLADEFKHTVGLMKLGMNPTAALQATAERVQLIDFDLLVSTVGLYTQTGGNLVLLLERLAESVRDRNQFRGQFLASTAQSRIVAIAIGAAAPLLLLVYLLAEPEHVQTFLQSPSGWSILAICAVMQMIGIIWLWQILKVDY
jgi:tight adherence protein B